SKINALMSDNTIFDPTGADYAEWLKQMYPNEKFQPGDIVSVVSGPSVTKQTVFPSDKKFLWLSVVTTYPSIIANNQLDGNKGMQPIAFLGQVKNYLQREIFNVKFFF